MQVATSSTLLYNVQFVVVPKTHVLLVLCNTDTEVSHAVHIISVVKSYYVQFVSLPTSHVAGSLSVFNADTDASHSVQSPAAS